MADSAHSVRTASSDDLGWLSEHDGHLSLAALTRKAAEGEIYVADAARGPVGLLRADWWWSRVPVVAQVFVVPDARHAGVASALLDALCADARARGEPYVFSSVTDGEAEPLRWHLAVGFAECGQIAGIDGSGSVERILRRDA